MNASIKKTVYLIFIFLLSIFISCDSLIEVEDPIGQIQSEIVFENENTADAAVTTLYAKLRDDTILTGGFTGLGITLGLYADEFDYYGAPGLPLESFSNHTIIASNSYVKNIWDKGYHLIYMTNSILEGLDNSQNLSNESKMQLKAEAIFIRALCHFYLESIFGDIPYIRTTDYLLNKDVTRLQSDFVIENILIDLNLAKSLISEDYISSERIRANKSVISAFLSRVYLYSGDWVKAEAEATEVINNTSYYLLEPNVENEFLKDSRSAILQFKPKNSNDNTVEGQSFIFETGPPINIALSNSFYNSFEFEDLRKENWIKVVTDGASEWYTPYKYKIRDSSDSSQEYSVVFRLSEQYLIRSEARLYQGNLSGSLSDLNLIRFRAGLNSIHSNNHVEMLNIILTERRHELFSEFGHRWFDLKRTNMAEPILSPIKPNWRSTNVLFPIPENELLINPNLLPQNPGY